MKLFGGAATAHLVSFRGQRLLDMRSQWRVEGGATAAGPYSPRFGRRKKRLRDIDLIVDLSEEPLSGRWWQGVATLSALFAIIAFIAPTPFEPVPAWSVERVGPGEAEQFRDLALDPLAAGTQARGRMAPNSMVEPLSEAPDRPFVEYFATLGRGDSLAQLLVRSGVSYAHAIEAARLISSAVPSGVTPGTSLSIKLGRQAPNGLRPVERIAFRAGLELNVTLLGTADGLNVQTTRIPVDNRPVRIRGRAGDGLYWALRASGVSPSAAGEYLRAIGGQIDVGAEIGPDDRFDLIVANRRSATGESQEGPLLYVAIERTGATPIRLMKWSMNGRTDWIDTKGAGQKVAAMAWPVAGRITSGFGLRVHPILRFARFHRGIDFGAGYGTPIVAASDGQVTKAGWAGGYGRQDRIAHGGGIVTSYSHMSRLIVEPGSFVRQGQMIGYVGSSGLSTGPHLHYEVYRNGTAVNPLGVKFASRSLLEGPELERFKARLSQLLAVGNAGQGKS